MMQSQNLVAGSTVTIKNLVNDFTVVIAEYGNTRHYWVVGVISSPHMFS